MQSILLNILVLIFLCCSVASDHDSTVKHLSSRRLFNSPVDLRRSNMQKKFVKRGGSQFDVLCKVYPVSRVLSLLCNKLGWKLKEETKSKPLYNAEEEDDFTKIIQIVEMLCLLSPETPECDTKNITEKKKMRAKYDPDHMLHPLEPYKLKHQTSPGIYPLKSPRRFYNKFPWNGVMILPNYPKDYFPLPGQPHYYNSYNKLKGPAKQDSSKQKLSTLLPSPLWPSLIWSIEPASPYYTKLKGASDPALQDAKKYADTEMELLERLLSEISDELERMVDKDELHPDKTLTSEELGSLLKKVEEKTSPALQNKINKLKSRASQVISTLAKKLRFSPYDKDYGFEDDGTIGIDVMGKRDFRYLGGKMKLFLQPKIQSLKHRNKSEKANEPNDKESTQQKVHETIAKEILTNELKNLGEKITKLKHSFVENLKKNASGRKYSILQ